MSDRPTNQQTDQPTNQRIDGHGGSLESYFSTKYNPSKLFLVWNFHTLINGLIFIWLCHFQLTVEGMGSSIGYPGLAYGAPSSVPPSLISGKIRTTPMYSCRMMIRYRIWYVRYFLTIVEWIWGTYILDEMNIVRIRPWDSTHRFECILHIKVKIRFDF